MSSPSMLRTRTTLSPREGWLHTFVESMISAVAASITSAREIVLEVGDVSARSSKTAFFKVIFSTATAAKICWELERLGAEIMVV